MNSTFSFDLDGPDGELPIFRYSAMNPTSAQIEGNHMDTSTGRTGTIYFDPSNGNGILNRLFVTMSESSTYSVFWKVNEVIAEKLYISVGCGKFFSSFKKVFFLWLKLSLLVGIGVWKMRGRNIWIGFGELSK